MNFKTYFLLVGFLLLAACDSSISTSGSSVGLPVSNDPKITFSGPTYTKVNSCYPLFVSSISGIEKSPVIQSTDLKVNFSSNAANQNLLYKDSSCASAVDSTIIGQGGYQSLLFFKAAATDVVVITGSTEYGLIVDPFQFSSFSGANQSAATSVSVYGPTNSFVNECTPFVALLTNSENAFIAPSQNVVVNLSGNDVGYFYSDASCGNLVTTATIVSESTSTSFYFKSGFNKNYILQAQATGLAPALANVNIAGLAAGSGNTNSNTSNTNSATRLLITGASNHSANSCSSFAVILADSTSQPYAAPANVAITLAASNAGTFYSDATCSTSAPIIINAGQSSAVFYFDTALSASFILKAQATNYAMAVFPVTFSSTSTNLATALELSGLTTLDSDQCAPFAVSALNNAGIATNTSSLLAVNLSAKNAGLFFSDSTCATGVTSATIASGKSVGYFYYKNNLKTSDLITTDNNALAEATLAIKINAAPVVPSATPKIIISGVPNIQTRQCSAFSVVSTDSSGNPLNVSANLTVNLSGAGNGTFYQNSNCSTTTTSVQITSGSSLATFYFQTTIAENVSLSTQSSGYLATSFPLQVLAASQQPVALKIVGTMTLNSDVCTPFTINAIDSNGINAVGASNISVTLANIGGSGTFYSDACTTSTSTVTISSGSSYASFYYRNTTAQNSLMTASGTGLGVASLPVVVSSSTNAPVTLKLAGNNSLGINTCSPYVVSTVDVNGVAQSVGVDTAVALAGNGHGGKYYSNDTCTLEVTAATITQNSSFKSFYFKDNTAENLVLLATSSNFALGSISVNVANPIVNGGGSQSGTVYVAVRLAITGPGQALSGSCAGEFSVNTVDANFNIAALTSSQLVSLSDGPGSGVFYDDAACTNIITTVNFAVGDSVKKFYYRNIQAESVSLQATTTALVAGAFGINVVQSAMLTISREVNTELWSNFFYRTFGTVSDYKVYVTNVGQTEARNLTLSESLAAPFSFKGGSFPGQGGTCLAGQTLFPGEQCSMVVRFQPTAGAPFPESFTLSYSNGVSTLIADHPLNGEGSDLLAPRTVVNGYNHTCVRYSDMSVKCWGQNASGQLGVGDTVNYGTNSEDIEKLPWSRLGLQTIAVSAGGSHSCIVNQDGQVACWGDNTYGQLGLGSASANKGTTMASLTPSYVNLGTGRTAINVSAGYNFTCAILDNGTVKCWGNNDYGQLGVGDKISRGAAAGDMGNNLNVVDLGPGRSAVAIAAGGYHVCAILDTNSVKCWGRNFYGQLGLGDTNNRGDNSGEMGGSLATVNLGGGVTVRQVAAGHEHTCVILVPSGSADAEVRCWGRNDVGQLGIGDNFARGTSPSHMGTNLKKADLGLAGNPGKLTLGGTHTCVLLQNGSVKCWGGNAKGQLGLGSTLNVGDGYNEMGNNLASVSMGGSFLAQDISAGYEHTCVMLDNRELRCWGRGDYGQLGHLQLQNADARGQSSSSLVSLPASHVNNYSYAESLASGSSFSCAIFGKNSVTCWGTTTIFGLMPKFPSYNGTWIIANAAKVVTGSGHVCVRTTDNKLYCWGANDYGQSGNGSYSPIDTPTLIQSDALDVAAYAQTTCYVKTNATVSCIGRSDNYQAGNTSTRNTSWIPVSGVSSASKVALGGTHSCALVSGGNIYCWGYGLYGQLGRSDNGTSYYSTAAQVNLNSRTASDLSLGESHSCAILSGANAGEVICWGRGDSGQLGNGQSIYIGDGAGEMTGLAAINLGTGTTAKSVSAFSNSTCAILSDDRMKCWGAASSGELGNESGTSLGTSAGHMGGALPYVSVGTNMRALNVGQASSTSICATFYDVNKPLPTQTFCWGANANGQLGDGGTTGRGSSVGSMSNLPLILNPKIGTGSASTILADYKTPGSYTFTVPEGVTAIEVQAWGGGGGSGYDGGCWGIQNASAGGGGYVKKNYTGLTPGKQYSLFVGTGGQYGASGCSWGNSGTNSWFDNSSSLIAGGGGGSYYYNSVGSGGSATGGDINIAGTPGNSSGGIGGNSPLGGAGGYGSALLSTVSQSFYNGGFPGGGGGGAPYGNYGGSGAGGRITIKNSSTNSGSPSAVGSTFNNPGVYTYTVPNGVYSLRIQMWGGGGGGGGSGYQSACGGGGGGYIDHVMQVNPGNSYLVSVGAGGGGGSASNTGGNGGDSRFGFGSEIITAGGGAGGYITQSQAPTCTGTGFGIGGIALNGVISTTGNRGVTSGAANRGTSGGDAPPSGAGGLGGVNTTNCHGAGAAGQAPGGGGAGAHDSSGNWCSSGYTGGAGASGRVVVTPFFSN
jgi:alpha-tubulin suppressor-like RCC1 family protein